MSESVVLRVEYKCEPLGKSENGASTRGTGCGSLGGTSDKPCDRSGDSRDVPKPPSQARGAFEKTPNTRCPAVFGQQKCADDSCSVSCAERKPASTTRRTIFGEQKYADTPLRALFAERKTPIPACSVLFAQRNEPIPTHSRQFADENTANTSCSLPFSDDKWTIPRKERPNPSPSSEERLEDNDTEKNEANHP